MVDNTDDDDNSDDIDEDGSDDEDGIDDNWTPQNKVDEREDDCDFDENCCNSSSDESSADEDAVVTVRTHTSSSSRYRHDVDMNKFNSLDAHLTTLVGMQTIEVTTLKGRVAEYIGWTMHNNEIDQKEAVLHIVNKHPLDILKYITMLKGPEYGLKNGTIYNMLLDLGRFAKYLSIYHRLSIENLLAIVECQQKIECKKKKEDIRGRLSIENLIDNFHWPKKGMQELRDILMKHKGRVDRIIQKCADGMFQRDAELAFAKDWIVTLLFVINPQGRVQAISYLTVKDVEGLCGSVGQVTSTKFKTSATYGSQAINFNPATQQYIRKYVDHIRPCASDQSTSDALFLQMNGTQHQDLGACITRTFRRLSKYHITTTVLRSIFETEVAEAVDRGTVTEKEMSNVIRNNGHSSTTSHNYYQKRKSEDAGRDAVLVHTKIYGVDEHFQSPKISTPCADSAFRPDDNTSEDDEDQPPRRRPRTEWTSCELSHLSEWIAQFDLKWGRCANRDWRACVKAMDDTGVFHNVHLTTTALREAWRRQDKRKPNNKVRV